MPLVSGSLPYSGVKVLQCSVTGHIIAQYMVAQAIVNCLSHTLVRVEGGQANTWFLSYQWPRQFIGSVAPWFPVVSSG